MVMSEYPIQSIIRQTAQAQSVRLLATVKEPGCVQSFPFKLLHHLFPC